MNTEKIQIAGARQSNALFLNPPMVSLNVTKGGGEYPSNGIPAKTILIPVPPLISKTI